MKKNKFFDKLTFRDVSVSLQHILDNSKADSGGQRDVNFLKYLLDTGLLQISEAMFKRSSPDIVEEYYLTKYKKESYESQRHFLCRTVIQEELEKLGIKTHFGAEAGNMSILRSTSNYDIVFEDFSTIMDIGLTPARNFFRGLTDLRVSSYLVTTYFDDYMDDIVFSIFTRSSDKDFLDAVKDYQEGFKEYSNEVQEDGGEALYFY